MGIAGYGLRLRFPSPYPYPHKVRRGRARPGTVASWDPAAGGMRRSRHFRTLGSKDRTSGRERIMGPCPGQRPRGGSSPTGLVSSRHPRSEAQARRPPSLRGARAAQARPNQSGPSARPFPSSTALIGRAAREGRLSLVAPARPFSALRATRNASGVRQPGLSAAERACGQPPRPLLPLASLSH